MVGSGGAGSTGTYSTNTSSMSQAAAGAAGAPAGHRKGPTLATATSPRRCRADLARGQTGTHRFGCLVPCQLHAVTGVPLLLLHVLQVPQVTVCTGETEGEESRKAELDTPAVPSRDLPPWPIPGKGAGRWVSLVNTAGVWIPSWPAPKQLQGSRNKHPE